MTKIKNMYRLANEKDFVIKKSPCCKADWYRKKRAEFRCVKCNNDITLYIVMAYKGLESDKSKRIHNTKSA